MTPGGREGNTTQTSHRAGYMRQTPQYSVYLGAPGCRKRRVYRAENEYLDLRSTGAYNFGHYPGLAADMAHLYSLLCTYVRLGFDKDCLPRSKRQRREEFYRRIGPGLEDQHEL